VFATKMHDNEVIFDRPSDLTLSMTYIDSVVTAGQPYERDLYLGKDTKTEYGVIFKAGRKKSKPVADYFIDATGGKMANHLGTDKPKELNFVVKTKLYANNVEVNGDFYIAQGSYAAGSNDWWMGCSASCLRADNKNLMVTTGNLESGNEVAYKIGAGLFSSNHKFKVDKLVGGTNQLVFSYGYGVESISMEEIPDTRPLTVRDVRIRGNVVDISYWILSSTTILKDFKALVTKLPSPGFFGSLQGWYPLPDYAFFYIETRLYINNSPVVNYLDETKIAPVYLTYSSGNGYDVAKQWFLGTSGMLGHNSYTDFIMVETQNKDVYCLSPGGYNRAAFIVSRCGI